MQLKAILEVPQAPQTQIVGILKVSVTKHAENHHSFKWKYSLTLRRTMEALRRQHIER